MKNYAKETVIRNMARSALRTIGVGFKDMSFDEFKQIQARLEAQQHE